MPPGLTGVFPCNKIITQLFNRFGQRSMYEVDLYTYTILRRSKIGKDFLSTFLRMRENLGSEHSREQKLRYINLTKLFICYLTLTS